MQKKRIIRVACLHEGYEPHEEYRVSIVRSETDRYDMDDIKTYVVTDPWRINRICSIVNRRARFVAALPSGWVAKL